MVEQAEPQTVARRRFFTRQTLQEDQLEAAGLVERRPDPRHARSLLVRATPCGEALGRQMDEMDERVLAASVRAIPARDLAHHRPHARRDPCHRIIR